MSAQGYFKNGNPDAAVQELMAASGKSQFDSFQTESRLDEEDLYLSSGYSQRESSKESTTVISQDILPELATYKQLAMGIGDLQKQYLGSGDANSAANLAQMGMNLGNQINSGDSGKYLINQLVGMAIEANSLRQLDQNTSYDFLDGQTPAQVLQQLKDQKTSLRELSQNASAAYPLMTQDEMVNYAERVNIYGETAAKQRLIQQHPPNTSQNGPQ
ncbi:MAG TPA: hypothetical protein VGF90_05085 [Verrucomicrobiae bacterium]